MPRRCSVGRDQELGGGQLLIQRIGSEQLGVGSDRPHRANVEDDDAVGHGYWECTYGAEARPRAAGSSPTKAIISPADQVAEGRPG